MHRPTYLKIDLNALTENYKYYQNKTNKEVIPVLKANAYGLGDVFVARKMQNIGVKIIALSSIDEAIHLRNNKIDTEILVLGYVSENDFELVRKYNLSIVTTDYDFVLKNNFKNIKVHLKIDSGMSRLGLLNYDEVNSSLIKITNDGGKVLGIMSHYANADDYNHDLNKKQYNLFKDIVLKLNYNFKYIHISNSNGIYFKDDISNCVRIGLGLLGFNNYEQLKTVISLYSQVISIRKLEKGTSVGYESLYKSAGNELIATLPLGYGDGFLRLNRNEKLFLNGKYYDIIGNICMDQLMVKVDETVKKGDTFEIFGSNNNLFEIAKRNNVSIYEYLVLLSERVERIYVDEKQVFKLTSRFDSSYKF